VTNFVITTRETRRGSGNIKMVISRTQMVSPDDFIPECRSVFLHIDTVLSFLTGQ